MLLMWVAGSSARASIVYDFDDGTLQGWTGIKTDPARKFLPQNPSGVAVAAPSSPYAVDETPFASGDMPHSTLLMRSPQFYLDGSGDLTIYLAGGTGPGTLPTSPAQIASTTSTSDGVHALGIGVRRVSDDTYIATARRSSGGNNWELVTISDATLDGYAGLSEKYTLDVFDSYAGGWGWISFDTATIPGVLPEPSSLTLVAAAMFFTSRRRR